MSEFIAETRVEQSVKEIGDDALDEAQVEHDSAKVLIRELLTQRPADEYYDDYYAVFFLDPDGIKLEGMKYGELTAKKKSRKKK